MRLSFPVLWREPCEESILQYRTRALSGSARQLDTQSSSRPLTRRESRDLAASLPPRAAVPGIQLRRLVRKLVPVASLGLAGALLVSVTVPATALEPAFDPAAAQATAAAAQLSANAQSVEVADVEAVDAERGEYTIVAPPKKKEEPKPSPARYGLASDSAAESAPAAAAAPAPASGTVRWPVDGLKVSDGFGYRVSPCAGCSSNHMGTDFTPGNGAPVYAIAAGSVSVVAASGGYGTHVYIDHVIDGQTVRSLYAHLQAGSAAVWVGQQVAAGTRLGAVGMTGSATGPHLHHEILVNGANVDPYAWLAANVR